MQKTSILKSSEKVDDTLFVRTLACAAIILNAAGAYLLPQASPAALAASVTLGAAVQLSG